MKGRTSAATLGLVGGLALGVWIGSEMTPGREAATPAPAVVTTQAAEAPAEKPQSDSSKLVRRSLGGGGRVARVNRSTVAVEAPAPESAPRLVKTIPVSAPELHARMKPVLARGTKLPVAAEGFKDAEQFATLAHAARNTQVPFILLKHRVIAEGQSLEDAIRKSKPSLDAKSEVARARAAARRDIAALGDGNANVSSN